MSSLPAIIHNELWDPSQELYESYPWKLNLRFVTGGRSPENITLAYLGTFVEHYHPVAADLELGYIFMEKKNGEIELVRPYSWCDNGWVISDETEKVSVRPHEMITDHSGNRIAIPIENPGIEFTHEMRMLVETLDKTAFFLYQNNQLPYNKILFGFHFNAIEGSFGPIYFPFITAVTNDKNFRFYSAGRKDRYGLPWMDHE